MIIRFELQLVAAVLVSAPLASAKKNKSILAFTQGYLNDRENFEGGKKIWTGHCRLCHGAAAYSGKAPKLKPRRYKPGFVYDRVTYGFRNMPAWEDVFTEKERMNVVVYVLSKKIAL